MCWVENRVGRREPEKWVTMNGQAGKQDQADCAGVNGRAVWAGES